MVVAISANEQDGADAEGEAGDSGCDRQRHPGSGRTRLRVGGQLPPRFPPTESACVRRQHATRMKENGDTANVLFDGSGDAREGCMPRSRRTRRNDMPVRTADARWEGSLQDG